MVSIQKGLPILLEISWLSTRSSGEKNGLGPAGGSGSGGSTAMLRPMRSCGDAGDGGEVGVLRIGVEDIDDGRDLADDGGGELGGDQLPVALHEDEGDQRLEQHGGGDDDDERAGEQALGQDGVDPARQPPPAGTQAPPRGYRLVDRRRHGDRFSAYPVMASR